MTEVAFHGAYIELQHLLKKLDLVQTGGEVKFFLAEKEIIVNGGANSTQATSCR
jgi:ribosome-associated protein YbcJ (S4-like RNA binding protein)